jgi:orotate phosphoribosyltransferase
MQEVNIAKSRERLLEILKKEAVFKEKIILSSGKSSDYYIDARIVTLSPEGAYLSAILILDLLKGEDIQAVGGPTLGADPIVGAIGSLSFLDKQPINTFLIRKNPKPHGKMKQIEGPTFKEGSQVVVIDDVATTGKSLVESVRILRGQGAEVKKAIVLIDRQEGAGESLEKENCQLISIFNSTELLK